TILCGARVERAERLAEGWRLETTRGPIECAWVVNAAGLFADDVARMCGVGDHRIVPVRGDYFRWRGAPRFERLVYPAPVEHAGGLGVHVTLDLAGGVRLGPDVQWGVERLDHAPPADEDARRLRFYEAGRALFPGLRLEALSWDGCGVRPKRRGPDELERDFHVAIDAPGLVDLVGIESPGLTAAMALAERVSTLVP
ncbi:MAG: FAD-dependent oxidoreductase, partial [Deltaproteobacteria bacterium]